MLWSILLGGMVSPPPKRLPFSLTPSQRKSSDISTCCPISCYVPVFYQRGPFFMLDSWSLVWANGYVKPFEPDLT